MDSTAASLEWSVASHHSAFAPVLGEGRRDPTRQNTPPGGDAHSDRGGGKARQFWGMKDQDRAMAGVQKMERLQNTMLSEVLAAMDHKSFGYRIVESLNDNKE